MRILFLQHFPLDQGETGPLVLAWASALAAAGREVRGLIVDWQRRGNENLTIDRVVSRPGDPTVELPFAIPQFAALVREGRDISFAALTDAELSQYRDQLRRRLDGQIDRFNPHIIHAQHIWVLGQLALETGVPYVLNAWPQELADYARDARYRSLADQAAENAGAILAPGDSLRQKVLKTFEATDDRVLIMPEDLMLGPTDGKLRDGRFAAEYLSALYTRVLDERFGNV